MAGWSGFTEEDLRQIKQSSSPGLERSQPRLMSITNNNSKQALRKKQTQSRDLLARQRVEECSQISSTDLPLSQRLSQSAKPESHWKTDDQQKPISVKSEKQVTGSEIHTSSDQMQKANVCISDKHTGVSIKENSMDSNGMVADDVKELDEQEALRIELSRVEQFRQQQKKIEEENKQRCLMLAEAIKQRSKMAKAEAEKLVKVQKELSHLDNLVTADVSIIRDRIEMASIEFLQAQKRYERAEKEFVAAKLTLAEKSELKESLTEHLYTIIQQNEIRKAARLAALMKELGLEGDNSLEIASIPPLLSFSPINTLHRPCFTPTSPLSPGPHEAPKQLIASSEQISAASNISQLQENDLQLENAVNMSGIKGGDCVVSSYTKTQETKPLAVGEGENMTAALESQDGGAETSKLMS